MSSDRSYLQHGRRHGPRGSDPIQELTNDWAQAHASISVPDSTDTNAPMSSIDYQTDDGSVFAIDTSAAVDFLSMLQVGTYLVHVIGDFGSGHSGTASANGNIGGSVVAYDWLVAGGTGNLVSLSQFNGKTIWEQLCVVTDLSSPAGVFGVVKQTSGGTLNPVTVTITIVRLT